MVSFSVRHDPVPASVKIDLELHQPYRTWMGLGRIEPDPPVDLGYINRIGSPFARLHLYRAQWPAALRRSAKDKATAIWHHAARHEAEVEG